MTTLQSLTNTIATKLKPRYNDTYIKFIVKPMPKLSSCQEFMDDLDKGYNVYLDHNGDGDLRATLYIKGKSRHYELVFVDDMGDPAVSLTRTERLRYYVEEL